MLYFESHYRSKSYKNTLYFHAVALKTVIFNIIYAISPLFFLSAMNIVLFFFFISQNLCKFVRVKIPYLNENP